MTAEISRADLLEVLDAAPEHLERDLAAALGWQCDEESVPERTTHVQSPKTRHTPDPATEPVLYHSRRVWRYWRVSACEPLAPPESTEESTDDSDAYGQYAGSKPAAAPPQDRHIAPLLRPGEWQNLWDRLPPVHQGGRRIDIPAAVRRLARAEPVSRLPRRPRQSFNRAVTLILDRPLALHPVWEDMGAAMRSLEALLGEALNGFHLPTGPEGAWLHLSKPGVGGREDIPEGSLVVLIGSFGALNSTKIDDSWLYLLEALRSDGHECFVVSVRPLEARAHAIASLDPAVTRSGKEDADLALHALLAALSQTWFPTVARLRELRRAIPGATLHTELLAYNAKDVRHDPFHLSVRPEALMGWLAQFRALSDELREPLVEAIRRWRDGMDSGAQDIERLQADLFQSNRAARYAALRHQAKQALDALEGVQGTGQALAQFCSMLAVIDIAREQDVVAELRPVFDAADRVSRALGRPRGTDAHADESLALGLHQRHEGLRIEPRMGGLLELTSAAYSPGFGQLVEGVLPVGSNPRVTIEDRGYRWTLEGQGRPSWAQRIWVDGDGLHGAHAEGTIFIWQPATPESPLGHWRLDELRWQWAIDAGVDDFGLWADLGVKDVRYRLRWIPPGRFMMGSPEDEPERYDDESQHEVELTEGFWLGETAVSQALWSAVMGDNPGYFKADDLPVERVSWDDCQGFIERLVGLTPSFCAALPTEAQWEYACRAGTVTPFSFGDTLSIDRANYDGKFPYNGGPEETSPNRTLPVQSFEPNPWGLYQMHGNVFEWCADWYGEYPTERVVDPTGPETGSGRVLRGGSWYYGGRYLRSANRIALPPDGRYDDFGLRLAGGIEPDASKPGAGALTADGREQSGRQGGGQGPRRDKTEQ